MVLTRLEIKRQILHIILGIILVVLIYFDIVDYIVLSAMAIIFFIVSLLSKRYKIPLFCWFFKHCERPEQMKRFPGKGPLFYLIGALVVVLLFEKDIALASITILTLGDSLSHLIGSMGKMPHMFTKKKKFEGVLAGGIAGFAGALLFVGPLESFLASFIAIIAEGIEWRIDDNVVVPFIAASIIWILRGI